MPTGRAASASRRQAGIIFNHELKIHGLQTLAKVLWHDDMRCMHSADPHHIEAAATGLLYRQFARFGVIGVLSTLLHVGTVVLAVEAFAVDPRAANVIAYMVAFPFAYFAHYHFSFACDHAHGVTATRFIVVSFACFLLGQGIMHVVYGRLGLAYGTALAAMIVTLPLVSFLLNRFFVFQRRRGSSTANMQ